MVWAEGIDVSHWQRPSLEFARQQYAAGTRYGWIKVSQGSSSQDGAAEAHHEAFGAAGIARGAYHFYSWKATPERNAANFLDAMQGLRWELRPVLDAESGGAGSRAATAAALLRFLELVARAGVVPIVYTYASWWNSSVEPRPEFRSYPLWIARYPNAYVNGEPPPAGATTPPAQPWTAWTVWQFSTTGGTLDRNVCTVPALAEITAHPTTTPTPPSTGEFTMDAAAAEQFAAIRKQLRTIEANMPRKAFVVRGPDGRAWICDEDGRWHVPDMETLNILVFTGQVQGFGTDGITEVTDEFLDGIPIIQAPK